MIPTPSKRTILYAVAAVAIFFSVVWTWTPATLLLKVPFTPQAPTANWARNEDCEEASITMANAYLNGNHDETLPPAVAQESIDSLKKWEAANTISNANSGNANTGAYATSSMAEGTFGLDVQQIRDYSQSDLKRALAGGNVVLLPVNARLLGNPAYQDNGPLYHMIVVRGYDDSGFIVNDPGTERGNGNVYAFAVLQKAAADWNNTNSRIDSTIKIALILSK